MESEGPVTVASELRKLTEAVTRLTSELHKVRTCQKELKSKLLELEGSKIYVTGDVNTCKNQPTMVHSQESSSSSLESAKDDLVDHSVENHQQNSESDVNDMVGPGSVTSLVQFNEMPAQTNLKLMLLVEAAEILEALEIMERGTPTPTDNSFTDLITVSQSSNEGASSRRSHNKRLPPSGKRMQKMIKCGHCERTFPRHHQVTRHERVHTGLRPYSCYICGVKFSHGGNMIKHMKSKHPSEKPYMCRYCQHYFKTHAHVLEHRKLCPVHQELIKKRRGSSSHKKKLKRQGKEGEETVTASEDENSRPSAAAKLPPHSSVDTNQIEFNVGLIPPKSVLAIKQESEEMVTISTPSSSLGHLHTFSYDNSTRDERGSTWNTFKLETSSEEHSTVPVNQLTMDRLKVEVDFHPD